MSITINAWDINVSILLNLLLANIRILYFFLFFLVISSNFLTIPVAKEKIRVKFALAIPTGAPITLANEIIYTPPVVTLKTTKILSI